MSWFKKHVQLTRREIALDNCYNELEKEDPASDRYTAIVQNVSKLESVPVIPDPSRLNKNTFWTLLVYAGLTISVIIIELFGNSITSRAMSVSPFKPRLM